MSSSTAGRRPSPGDYLWISSQRGLTYGVWSDWRDTVAGTDQRETTPDERVPTFFNVGCRIPTAG